MRSLLRRFTIAEHRGAATADEIDGAVRVGRRAALADRDDQRVAHVETHPEAAQLGGGDRIDVELAVGQRVEHRGHAATGDRRGALADDLDLGDAAVGETGADVGGQGTGTDRCPAEAVDLDDLAAHGLAEAGRRLADLLQQEVRRVAAVDVARGDLRGADVARRQRQIGAVVGDATDAFELAGVGAIEHEHLPTASRIRRSLAVHPHERRCLLDNAVRLAGDDVAVVGEADVHRLAAAAQREEERVGMIGAAAPIATLPSNSATVRRNASPRSATPSATWRAITAGITLASVVIGPAMRRSWRTLMSAWLSTSPLSTATMYGARRRTARALRCSADGSWLR